MRSIDFIQTIDFLEKPPAFSVSAIRNSTEKTHDH